MNEPQTKQPPTPDSDDDALELEYRDFKSGQVIFQQGEIGAEAYFVDSGKVEIARGDGTAPPRVSGGASARISALAGGVVVLIFHRRRGVRAARVRRRRTPRAGRRGGR